MRKLTRDLIAVDSVTGNEGRIARFLQDELTGRGWEVRLFEVDGERANVYATLGEGPPRILFNTHIDTVPPAYGPEEDDRRIYGRGACDTHGLTSAMLEALEEAHQRGVGGLGLLLVVGEETDHLGAIAAGKQPQPPCPEVLVVGEPTENKFLTSQKGILAARLRAVGREGHSGYPERFESAVEKILPALEALRTADWLARDSADGNTVNISSLRGGDAFNKVPGEASATLLFRLAEPAPAVRARADALLRAACPDLQIEWGDGYSSDPVARIDALPDHPTGVAAFNTDLPYFGWQPQRWYLVGPGSILQAHRDPVDGDRERGEWIDKQEQEAGAFLYLELIEKEAKRLA